MYVPRGSCKGYEIGAEGQCYYAMHADYAVVQHVKPDVNSPLLEAAPTEVI